MDPFAEGVIFILIGFFFAFTGGYSILKSLEELGKHKSDSTLDTKFFKLNAPIGFVYGILAFGIIIAMMKYNDFNDQSKHIAKQRITIDSLTNKINTFYAGLQKSNDDVIIREFFPSQTPKSIFNGKILVVANCCDWTLTFTGTAGVSNNLNGPFDKNIVHTDKGQRFYFKSDINTVWAVNVLDNDGGLKVEIFKQ